MFPHYGIAKTCSHTNSKYCPPKTWEQLYHQTVKAQQKRNRCWRAHHNANGSIPPGSSETTPNYSPAKVHAVFLNKTANFAQVFYEPLRRPDLTRGGGRVGMIFLQLLFGKFEIWTSLSRLLCGFFS